MTLFNATMKAYKEMTCGCCDQVLPIWKLQRPKMKAITQKMEKLLTQLAQTYKKNPKLRKNDPAFIMERDDPNFFLKPDDEQISDLVNSLHYYSDRWSYSRYTRAKAMWSQFKKIQKKYQKTWDKNSKLKSVNT